MKKRPWWKFWKAKNELLVVAIDHDSRGNKFDTVRLLGDEDAVRAVVALKSRAEKAESELRKIVQEKITEQPAEERTR